MLLHIAIALVILYFGNVICLGAFILYLFRSGDNNAEKIIMRILYCSHYICVSSVKNCIDVYKISF
jgi:hypothetical protein